MQELVAAVPADHEAALLAYLTQGVVCGIYNDPGLLFDVLQPGQRIEVVCQQEPRLAVLATGPSLLLTDGAWVWPGVLPYYVAVYHLRLPGRFLQFAADHDWKIDPSTIKPDEVIWDAYDAVPELPVAAGQRT
jgi:hypothetical protein